MTLYLANCDDACIIGVPYEEGGNTVRAVVEREDGEQMQTREIMAFCHSKATGYKIPRCTVFNTRCRSRRWANCSVKE